MLPHEIAAYRMMNQRITGQKFDSAEAVVRWMGAVQAQDYHQAVWAVGVRMQSATLTDVEAAIAEGRIIRTWPMRGTIHFVPPEDARWMLDLCGSRMAAGSGGRLAQLDLTEAMLASCEALFIEALSGGKRLTRQEMLQVVSEAGISTDGQRGYHILWQMAHKGVICLGPMQGKQQTFALLDDWAPQSRDLTRDEALAELVRRFFTSHGPATEKDFARWSGLTLTDTRRGISLTAPELTATTIDNTQYWLAESETALASDTAVHLLPGYDEYVIGYQDRTAVLAAEHAQKIVPGNNGVFQPMIVIKGQVAGTWKRSLKRKAMEITLLPFAPLGDFETQVIEATRAYSAFMGLPVSQIHYQS